MGNVSSKNKDKEGKRPTSIEQKQPHKSIEKRLAVINDNSPLSASPSIDSSLSSSTATSNKTLLKLFPRNKKCQNRPLSTATIITMNTDNSLPPLSISSSTLTTTPINTNNTDSNSFASDGNHCPMVTAAARLSARYDEEKFNARYNPQLSSCAPCIVSQLPGRRPRMMTEICKDVDSIRTMKTIFGDKTTFTDSPLSFHEEDDTYMNQVPPTSNPSGASENDKVNSSDSKSSSTSSYETTVTATTMSPTKKKRKRKLVTSQQILLELFLKQSSEEDRRKEKDRQQRLHYLLKRIWKGKIYHAALNKNNQQPSLVVNWCCGAGTWCLEMAAMFPNTKVIGIDFKEATSSNLKYALPNLDFKYVVIHDRLTGLETLEENSVDFVMLRDVWIVNAPVSKWEHVLKEVYRILKPGGWIELQEHSLVIGSAGPYNIILHKLFDRFFNELQVDRTISIKLGGYLEQAGYVDISQYKELIPLGEWCSTPDLKESGFLFKDLMERRTRVLSKWVSQVCNISRQEMNRIITIALEEEPEEYHPCIDWISYTARKPIT
ncbi:MAG: S-adenosyl-L-methionine-dependent methyltransferase [Benjaminiella poitrasii]|nr:MAG: S-adenosyl-L-methionine-dependent methyltransferase [Benjaminiella poitrasii]